MGITPEQMQKYGNALLAAPLHFARTMPDNPHWYTLRKDWKDKHLFDEIVLASRAYGYTEWFAGRPWQMFDVGDRKFWTCMGEVGSGNSWSTILINTKPRDPEENPYDAIAPDYDAAFSDEESKEEERLVMDIIGDIKGQSVLDIGCGTGLLLDYKEPPASYVGIDPSAAMLQRLRQKHDLGDWGTLVQCKFEDYAGPKVDLAICLFGSAMYIRRDFIEGIAAYLKPGGRYVIMAGEESYTPVTYERLGFHQEFTSGLFDLDGEITKINHYYVYDGRI